MRCPRRENDWLFLLNGSDTAKKMRINRHALHQPGVGYPTFRSSITLRGPWRVTKPWQEWKSSKIWEVVKSCNLIGVSIIYHVRLLTISWPLIRRKRKRRSWKCFKVLKLFQKNGVRHTRHRELLNYTVKVNYSELSGQRGQIWPCRAIWVNVTSWVIPLIAETAISFLRSVTRYTKEVVLTRYSVSSAFHEVHEKSGYSCADEAILSLGYVGKISTRTTALSLLIKRLILRAARKD